MLGIIIANWNGEKLIDKCLKSLNEQTFKDFKIYIIDNDSKDNSNKIINYYKSKLNIELTNLDHNSGFAKANNIGIKQAIRDKCDYILTLNNDVELTKNCLENAVNNIKEDKDNDIFQLFMVNYYDRNKCDAVGLLFDEKLIPIQLGLKQNVEKIMKSEVNIEGVCAGAAIYSSKCLEKVKLDENNYFDSNFFAYYEDVDLALRLKNAGFKSTLLKDSIVYHMHSATGNKTSGFKEYYLARNLFLYTKRNQPLDKFNKLKFHYYIIILKSIIKNITNMKVIKSILKGLRDSKKEILKIEYKKID